AGELLRRTKADTKQLMVLLERLHRASTHNGPSSRALATIQLEIIDRLLAGKLTDDDRRTIRRHQAAALAAAGDRSKAAALFAELAAAEPRNGELQEAYATFLAAGTDAASTQAALDKWRQIAARSQPHQPRWYRAKYAIVELQIRLGKR